MAVLFLLLYLLVGREYYSCLSNDTYVFIGNDTSIEKSIYSTDGLVWETLIKAKSKPLGMDVDIATCMLFYSRGDQNLHIHQGEIYAVNLTNNNSTTIHHHLGNPVQVAVYGKSKKLFWCDSKLSTIEYSDFDGRNKEILLKNVIGIKAMALDSFAAEIYWINKENTYAISKIKLDGTNRQEIVSSSLNSPNSLVVDFLCSRLYWTDGNRIQTSDLDGKNISTVYTTDLDVRRATAITVYNDTYALYWAEWMNKRIVTCTTEGRNNETLVDNVMLTAAIHILDGSSVPGTCSWIDQGN